ncbi:sugar phosphate isomerase/epimerase family protein [Crassaminicella profunda]|uniref:sugar phosphate isomerase/epimerase family protein n=1 Tax=Crassaminicella profunda TaxID=1286698 RepID=UPI001CA72CFB|nr:sugar phosphate isomerase/epimerase [Crassaminicella profunda]QZY53607.1 sugar phosphate isomerase/epimerase [Crassaminicella profunda]
MKICFNEATTMKYSTLEKDLEFCEKHGYDLIEIRIDQLKDYLKRNTVEDLVGFFENSHIKPFAFNALEFISFRTEEKFNEIIKDLEFICEVGEKIGCNQAVVVPTFDVGAYTVEEIKKETVDKINVLADIAEKRNFKLAFEFVGYPNCSVNRFEQAYDIVKTVNKDHVGIVLDCFHFHAMLSKLSDLKEIDVNKLFIFHIDDAENLPFGALRDDKRLWPGDGFIDLDGILKTLKEIGYNKMVSIELFRPEYWEWDIEKTIQVGKEKTIEAVSKYFEV